MEQSLVQTSRLPLAPYLFIAAAMVGIGDTLFLSYNQFLNLIPACAIGGCDIVLTSVYAHPLGFPLAYAGLLFYLHVLGLGLLLAIDPNGLGTRLGALIYSGVGLLMSIAFELIQIFVIGAMCLYCGISAFTTLVLFVIAFWHFRSTRRV